MKVTYKNSSTCEEQHLQEQDDKLMTLLLCPYAAGQIIDKQDGTQEIVTRVYKINDEFIVVTRVLTESNGYYKVRADGSLNSRLTR